MHFEQDIGPSEGLFDAQLALPLAGAAAPEPFSTVVKRDGRVEPFQTAKIAAAIMRASAATAPGEAEHAWDLAKAVRVHLWKQLGSETPHVDQVHEAVERVLVAMMTRQRTALAYARYRARRARQRENCGAARTAYSSSLEEDDHAREALGGRPDALLVRTSADTLAAWDRGKITAALVRETGLRENTAEAIALEVEQQIAAARIESLTASLVRELVDAKLAEHGLGEYRERHRRLGVPLYDTALMMRGAADKAFALGPDGTDRVLARVLKKEYALAEVFSPTAAEAHLRGDLHICGLGEIDRYASARLPLGAMRANGLGGL
jgi:anaerobic ribonucleoside-triphosphate reductase